MKPVLQTTFYPKGNCYAACVASILELPLSEVPDFFNVPAGQDRFNTGYERVADWLAQRGLGILRVLPMFDGVWVAPVHLSQPFFCIASGDSPRHQCGHAIVWGFSDQHSAPVHDPHPDGGYFNGEDPKSFDLIVRLQGGPA